MWMWVLWLFAGIISFLFSFAMIVDWEYQSAIMRVIGVLAPFLGIFFFKLLKDSLLGKKSSESDKELPPTYIGATLRDCFFVECVLSSCNDFTKKKNVDKAKLIADKYGLSYPNGIEELYNKAYQEHLPLLKKVSAKKSQEIQSAERAEESTLSQYWTKYGRDKKISMLTDIMNKLRNEADTLDKGARIISRSAYEKEADWAFWGGVASGIAGLGAGVATAIDLQTQNAQTRLNNEKNMRASIPYYMAVTQSASDKRDVADRIEREIDSFKEALIEDVTTRKFEDLILVKNVETHISQSGAVKIAVALSEIESKSIYDDVPAVLDGSFFAHIIQEGEIVGKAKLVLPVQGLDGEIVVEGIALCCADVNKKTSVEFKTNKMWLIERLA